MNQTYLTSNLQKDKLSTHKPVQNEFIVGTAELAENETSEYSRDDSIDFDPRFTNALRKRYIYICCFRVPHSISLVTRALYFLLFVITTGAAYFVRYKQTYIRLWNGDQ